MQNCSILPSLIGIGFKYINFGGIFLGKEFVKTIFACGSQGCRIISVDLDYATEKDGK
jgi:hypothetical protein